MALQKLNAQVLEGGLALDNNGNMTLTGNLYATDVGDDDDPIEDFYVSEDSIWIGDQHKVQISSTGKMKFRRRKTTTVPAVIAAAGGDESGALTHSGKSSLTELKKKHWRLYARSLGGSLANAKNKDIFRDNRVDYQQESDADIWEINDAGNAFAPSTAFVGLPAGTVAQRGTGIQGGFRFNTETPGFEGYDGTEWGAIGGGSASELSTATTVKLKGSYAETMLFSDAFTLEGDLTLTDNLFLAKLGDDGSNITLTDDGTSRTITGAGTLVPGALFDNSFAIATAVQPNITQIGTTASIKVPTGTTAQRGTALTGAFRYNTTTPGFEGYDGTEWGTIGGGGLKDDDEDTYITAEATADSDDLDFWTAGTKRMTIDQTGNVVINEDGNDIDFRIEADDINNIFFVTGYGSGKVGVGTAAPNVKFEVLDINNDVFMRVQSKLPNGNKKNGLQLWGDRNWQILNDGSATYGTADYFHIQDATASYASRLTIDTSGNIGIGTTSIDHQLQIKKVGSGNTYLRFETDGTHGVKPEIQFDSGLSATNRVRKTVITGGYDSATGGSGGYFAVSTNNTSESLVTALTIDSSQHMYVTGDVTSSASDERLKENIEIIENAVDKIKTLNGVRFNWNKNVEALGFMPNQETEVGVIAQQVKKVLPEAVTIAPFDRSLENKLTSKSGENYLTVKYEKIVPLLIEAIKEQQIQISELKKEIKAKE